MLVTIAIPCYKSAKTLPRVIDEIDMVFNNLDEYEYEVILVNDGSPDNTFEVIHTLCNERSNVIGVGLSRNFGQSSAKSAAIPFVNGDVLVYMDDDGQHPVSGIIPLVEKVLEGYDIVYADFLEKKHNVFKRITSNIHHWLLEKTGSKPKEVNISSFMAFSSFSIQALKENNSPVILSGAYLRRLTNRLANIKLEHRERMAGKSGYTLKRLFNLWFRAITSFNIVPLRIATIFGMLCGSCGLLGALIVTIQKNLRPSMPIGYASTMVVVLVLCGMIMMMIGILGEYIGKMYLILCRLPPYKVRSVVKKTETDKEKIYVISGDDYEE